MQYLDHEEERIAQWQAAAAALLPEVAKELGRLRDDPCAEILPAGPGDGTWRWITQDCPAWTKTLIFRNTAVRAYHGLERIRGAALTGTEGGFLLRLPEACEGEARGGFEVAFSEAALETALFDYTRAPVPGKNCPWGGIGRALSWLAYKAEQLGKEALSEGERALLPLTEFKSVFHFADASVHITAQGAAGFARYAGAAGREDLAALAQSLGDSPAKKAAGRQIRRLQSLLEKKESEGLWRSIAADVRAAAGMYPGKWADCVKETDLNRERESVTRALRSRGFEGNYPDFYRRGRLRGLHLRDTGGVTHFAGLGRTMDSYIQCVERYDCDGRVSVDYVTSTVFPRRGEEGQAEALDACSGFFGDQNRRFGAALAPALRQLHSGALVCRDNEEIALLAAKTAQLGRLTRKEWEKLSGDSDHTSALVQLLALALAGGVMFGAVMTAGMGLISLLVGGVVTLLTGRDAGVLWGLLAQLPWGKLFLWCGGASGGIMALITAASRLRSPHR